MKRVLFFRNFDAPSGGHLKLRDYFEHVRVTPGFEAKIMMAAGSRWDKSNPWWDVPELVIQEDEWRKYQPDLLFLEGMDWEFLKPSERAEPPMPVVNLIQGLRHADSGNPRYEFLTHPATRICVSPEVQAALEGTRRVNGRLVTNINGIDPRAMPALRPAEKRMWDLVVVGAKHPGRARAIGEKLAKLAEKKMGILPAPFPGLRLKVLDEMVEREKFLEILVDARAALFMPLEQEGFYLPALEAMALGTLVICPDVVGNRSFCLDGLNCLRPPFTDDALLRSCRFGLRLSVADRQTLTQGGRKMAENHTLEGERRGFRSILEELAKNELLRS